MSERKPFVLRISREMMDALQRLAADEFRSVNGQIEAILADQLGRRGYMQPPPGRPILDEPGDAN